MCHLRNIAMHDYQENVTTGQTHTHTDRQTPDIVIPMCRYASQGDTKTGQRSLLFSKRLSDIFNNISSIILVLEHGSCHETDTLYRHSVY